MAAGWALPLPPRNQVVTDGTQDSSLTSPCMGTLAPPHGIAKTPSSHFHSPALLLLELGPCDPEVSVTAVT